MASVLRIFFKAWLSVSLSVFMFVTTAYAAPREMMDLDGVWNFATDPDDRGETEQWFMPAVALPAMPLPGYAPEANGAIRVPGIWDNQGYGVETDKVRHNFVGKGWYKRQANIPRSWAGRRVFFVITGVSRSAKAWVNGHYLGEHIGFVSAFEWEVTKHIAPGQCATLVIEVDSEQRWEIDALYGACSLTDYMDVAWGGIWGHVSLEARQEVWLSDLYIQPNVAESTCTVTAALNGRIAACDAVKLDVFDAKGEHVAESLTTVKVDPASPEPMATITEMISNLALWTPDRPTLYTAKLTLLKGIEALDAVESRFGMRQFSIDGSSILLNGKRILLRGYGDDHIYPEQMAMPSDKELHLKQLRIIKSYGFNHVVEDLPSCPNIIIRALPSMVLMQESALLFQVGVGKGCLIASGLNHRRAPNSPENQWLLARLLAHAATFPNPKATWPESFLLHGQAKTE